MARHVMVASRYCGPPNLGNGGYTCGVVAAHVDTSGGAVGDDAASGAVQVRLRAPVPLDRALTVDEEDGAIAARDGDTAVAIASAVSSAELHAVDVPAMPSFDDAAAAMAGYRGFREHPFATCFVCGPERKAGDGMRVFPGPIEGRALVASTWLPSGNLLGDDERVRPEFMWAALDCPGGFAALLDGPRMLVLGQLTALIRSRPARGERCIVIGWPIARDERKHFVGTAVFSESGQRHAWAKAIWIEPRAR